MSELYNQNQNITQDENKQASTIQRSPHDRKNPYVMISKRMLQDKNLSPRTKGIFCFLLSHPDDWKTNPKQIAKDMGVNKDQIYAALDELMEFGYCLREDVRDKGKFNHYSYFYFEESSEEIKQKNKKDTKPPCPEKPDTVFPDLEKQTQTIKERTKDICNDNDIVCESSPDKQQFAVLFDASTYKLRDGRIFQELTARRYAKLEGQDLQRLVRNIHYYESQYDAGIRIDSHEKYIENAFKHDYAGKEGSKLPNKIYAEMMRQEHDLPGIIIKKTVVWLDKKDGNRPESLSLSLPEESFGNTIDNYVKTMKDKS